MRELARDPGPGACVGEVGGGERVLRIRLGEIERFEDRHASGFYAFFDKLRGEGKPSVREIRDLIALALVGGGLTDREADEVMRREGPDRMIHHLGLAQEIMMATLIPAAEDRAMLDAAEAADDKKKASGSTSGESSPAPPQAATSQARSGP